MPWIIEVLFRKNRKWFIMHRVWPKGDETQIVIEGD